MMGEFHFLRPWWLMALVPAAVILWRLVRLRDPASRWRGIVAPHLLSHLMIRGADRRRGAPIVLLALVWGLCVLAVAGPTWRREPAPFADDTAALVFVMKVTSSMRIADVQPDRLARSVQKIHDLLKRRAGAKAALIAYSGSAHVVVPLTSDAGIIDTFAEPLDPGLMPVEGDDCVEALQLARRTLSDAKAVGSIVWITDGASPEVRNALASASSRLPRVNILAPLGDGTDLAPVRAAADAVKGSLIQMSADDSDLDRLAHDAQFSEVADKAAGEQWHESGYAMSTAIVLLAALWFRPGVLGACVSGGNEN